MNDLDRTTMLELPPYRAVLSVDVCDFSGTKAADHRALTEKIPLVLEQAFRRGGHASVWEERRFPADRGDGFVVGFRPDVLPVLVGPFLDSLQHELAYHHQLRPGSGPRMRVSIAVGPLTDSDADVGRLGDGSGSAMVENHRLLDCDPVRRLLIDSDPEVTFVAAVVSARVFEDVVLSGYADKAAAEFIEVPVAVKKYRGTAYLHVPKPSGALLHKGMVGLTHVADRAEQNAGAVAADGKLLSSSDGTAGQPRDHRGIDRDRCAIRGSQRTKGDGNVVIGGDVAGSVTHESRSRREGRTS
jgi:hypothetical protein